MTVQHLQDKLEKAQAEIARLKQLQPGCTALNDTSFRSVLDSSPVPQALNDNEQNIIYVNPAFVNTFGYDLSDIPTLPDWWVLAYPGPQYRDNVINGWQQKLTQSQLDKQPFESMEVKICCKDGSHKIVMAGAASLHDDFEGVHLVTLYDVSNTKSVTAELNKTVVLLENVINSTPDLIAVKNKKLQTILCNKAFSKAVGKKRQDMYGQTDIQNGWDPELVNGNPDKGIRGFKHDDLDALSGMIVHNPYDPANIEGQIRIFDTHKLPLKDSHGKIIGMILIARDITERISTEEQLRQSQKMDALGKLTGGIAHDFNNMLGVIIGYSDLLQEKAQDDSQSSNYVKQIVNAANRAHILTSKLLAFSRKQPTEMKEWNINDILSDDRHMLEKTLTARVKLILNQDSNLYMACIDRATFSDAILNLCINAMHAMPDGGTLTITTKNQTLTDIYAQTLAFTAGEYIHISITDTGTGMSAEVKEKLFEPFFTTKDSKGTGLGLSQVYGFVKQSKGNIQVYSEPGKGARFVILLPRLITTPAEHSAPTTIPHSVKTQQAETILIVDDEPALRELTEEILEQNGYHVLQAEDASAALEILAGENIHLMLTDVIMPGISGYQLAAQVSEKYPQIKIIIASGYNDEALPHKNLTYRYLDKPFSSDVLITTIQALLN